MHGRVKVRTSAEQEAIKKKERAEKLVRFKAGISKVFEKRKNQVYDDELLLITERMLIQNPDIYTLWNIRREAIVNDNGNDKPKKELYEKELSLTENCLKENPKSYWVWYQRIWIVNRLEDCDWKRELMLCSKCLNLDERNFHCWNYRGFIVQKAGISPEEEFEFSTSKILNNFSNYSSWHYRSRLLSKMFDGSNKMSIDKQRKDELELVMNATFTDPSDTSAWFYQRWLLDIHKFEDILAQCLISNDRIIVLTYNSIKKESIRLLVNNQSIETQWTSWQKCKFSKLWFGKFNKLMNDPKEIQVEIEGSCCSLKNVNQSWIYKSRKNKLCYNKEQLIEQLSSYKQLAKMEPNNKWAQLTAVLLMKQIDFSQYYNDIVESLTVLDTIDPLRSKYYKDLRSKYIVEYKLQELWDTEGDEEIKSQIDLSMLDVSTLGSNKYLSFYKEINLAGNQLSDSLWELSLLHSINKLSLSSNHLHSLNKFPTLETLEVLSLRDNELNDAEEIKQLVLKHKLKLLDIRENPVCNIVGIEAAIRENNLDLQLYI